MRTKTTTAHKRPVAKPVTALAVSRRRDGRPAKTTTIVPDVAPTLQVPQPVDLNVLGEDATMGALGLVEVTLTDREEAVLAQAVQVTDVLVKPTGQAYLSHPSYTRWFNNAFGRTGWALVQKSKPLKSGNSIVAPYILYVHGQPVAFAYGEQEYHETNKEQTYGDALEATVASALRRCAKRLGVGLELWDKRWLRQFEATHVVKVWLKDKDKPAFRLKSDPPFWNEVGQEGKPRGDASRGRPATERPAATNPHANDPITDDQVKRFWTIARRAGRTDAEIKIWLSVGYQVESTKAITRGQYEDIVHAIEHPGPLQIPPGVMVDREPGWEG